MHIFSLPLILLLVSLSVSSSASAKSKIPARDANTDITVFTAGDIADCNGKKSKAQLLATTDLLNTQILANPAAIVLTLGDHTYPVGSLAEFETCYEPTWGKFKNRTYPTPGNHEYYSPEAYGYFQYFGDQAKPNGNSWYSFNQGAWHIISLNSNLKKEDRQAQLKWLKNDLDTARSACTLAYWHHPVFNSGLRGDNVVMKDAWEILMAAKADLVLSGHEHHYERFTLQDGQGKKDESAGIRQFVVGTGGVNIVPAVWQKTNSEVMNTEANGVLKLTLKRNGYEWQFLSAETGQPGTPFTDTGSALCHKKNRGAITKNQIPIPLP